MKKSHTYFLSFFIPALIFFWGVDSAFCQDSVTDNVNYRTGMTLGVGLPSGPNLFIHQQLFGWMYAEAGAGFYFLGYSWNGGIKIRIGGDSSNQVVGLRYSRVGVTVGGNWTLVEKDTISVWYGNFNLKPSDTPFFYGIGLTFGTSSFVFAEIGVRLFSF